MNSNSALIEALLFARGSEGATTKEVAKILKIKESEVKTTINEFAFILDNDNNRGLKIVSFDDRYKLVTKHDLFEKIEPIIEVIEVDLKGNLLEVLSIVAYRQPITKLEIEKVRGINSDYIVKKLIAMDMIIEVGRASKPGKPMLYGTTPQFLDKFGLQNINNLPQIEVNGEITLFK